MCPIPKYSNKNSLNKFNYDLNNGAKTISKNYWDLDSQICLFWGLFLCGSIYNVNLRVYAGCIPIGQTRVSRDIPDLGCEMSKFSKMFIFW